MLEAGKKFDIDKALNMSLDEYGEYRKSFMGNKTIYNHDLYNVKYIMDSKDAIMIAGMDDCELLIPKAVEECAAKGKTEADWNAILNADEETLKQSNDSTQAAFILYDTLVLSAEMTKEKYVIRSIDESSEKPAFEEFKRKVDAGDIESVYMLIAGSSNEEK